MKLKDIYDQTLTADNADKRGMLRLKTYLITRITGDVSIRDQFLVDWGAKLGFPNWINSETKNGEYPWYFPKELAKKIEPDIKIDMTLTPENAKDKGYVWETDVELHPEQGIENIIKYFSEYMYIKDHCRLGQATLKEPNTYSIYVEKGYEESRSD